MCFLTINEYTGAVKSGRLPQFEHQNRFWPRTQLLTYVYFYNRSLKNYRYYHKGIIMLEKILEKVLERVVGEYVEGISNNQMKVGIWNGDIDISNIRLKSTLIK